MRTDLKSIAAFAALVVGAYGAAKFGGPLLQVVLAAQAKASADASAKPAAAAALAGPIASASAPPDEEAWTGVLVAQAVDLTARIDTKVKGFSFRVGDFVRAEDVVAELDATREEHDIAAAEASLRVAQAETWSASVSVSQARDRQARRSKLFKIGDSEIPLVSAEELSDSKFDALSASSRASAASASADERRARLGYLHQVVQEASLRAPFDGVVATRYVETNAHVRPGTPVIRIVGRGGLRVRFAVPEAEAPTIRLSSRVVIEWDDRTLEATVDRIAPEVESASSSIVMEASVEGPAATGADRSALAGRVVGVRVARARRRG